MASIFTKLMRVWISFSCILLLGNRCVIILFRALRRDIHRDYINAITKQGATKLLNIVKANYNVEFISKDSFEHNQAYVFMSNHQSLFDIPLIFATLSGTIRPVTKSELFRIPIFGAAMKIGECIPISRGSAVSREKFMEIAKHIFSSGASIWIFPEGTRSSGNQLLPFKSGGFYLAKDLAAKIVPVGILNTHAILPRRKLLVSLNQDVTIRIGEPLDLSSFTDIGDIKNTVYNAIEHLLRPVK